MFTFVLGNDVHTFYMYRGGLRYLGICLDLVLFKRPSSVVFAIIG